MSRVLSRVSVSMAGMNDRETLLEDSSFIEMEVLVSEGKGGKRSREDVLQGVGALQTYLLDYASHVTSEKLVSWSWGRNLTGFIMM